VRLRLWAAAALALLGGAPVLAQSALAPSQAVAYRLPGRPLNDSAVGRPDSLVRPADPWLGPDKALHAGGSFLMTLSGQYLLTDKTGLSNGEALPLAAGATLSLGLLKEILDSRRAVRPHFSWRDLAADAAGVALAAALVQL
jgi:uncharacterized protein YfiM (DUF2279 family)